MATTVLTGRQCTLSVDGDDFTDQILSSSLNMNTERLTFDTFSGKAYKVIDVSTTLTIEFLADWTATDSLCQALWDAAESDPDEALDFEFTVETGVKFEGTVLPSFPSPSGEATDGQRITLELQVEGEIDQTAYTPPAPPSE